MRNILNPGDAFATGQIMRESVRGMRASLEAVKDIYKKSKYVGIGCGIKSTGIGNGTVDSGHLVIRVLDGGHGLELLTGWATRSWVRDFFHDRSTGGVRRNRPFAGPHDRPLGQRDGLQVRRDVGVACDNTQLRGGTAGGTTARRRFNETPNREAHRPRVPRRLRL